MRHRNKNHGGNHPSHERWIVSYADFVTLLFAFLVVMFATANADKGKARAVGESVRLLSRKAGSAMSEMPSGRHFRGTVRRRFTSATWRERRAARETRTPALKNGRPGPTSNYGR